MSQSANWMEDNKYQNCYLKIFSEVLIFTLHTITDESANIMSFFTIVSGNKSAA